MERSSPRRPGPSQPSTAASGLARPKKWDSRRKGRMARSAAGNRLAAESGHSSAASVWPFTCSAAWESQRRSGGSMASPWRAASARTRAYESPISNAPYSGRSGSSNAVNARPPTRSRASRTSVSRPAETSFPAAARPAKPAPSTSTSMGLAGSRPQDPVASSAPAASAFAKVRRFIDSGLAPLAATGADDAARTAARALPVRRQRHPEPGVASVRRPEVAAERFGLGVAQNCVGAVFAGEVAPPDPHGVAVVGHAHAGVDK